MQAPAAFDPGARSVANLFNAMRLSACRDLGPAGAVIARGDVTVLLRIFERRLARRALWL